MIARFRSEFADTFSGLFAEILTICAQAGMVRVGSVAIDGTKIAANASLDRSKRESTLRQMAARIVEEAAQVDAAEDAADAGLDDRVGPGMADPAARAAAIDAALEQIAADRRERPDPGLTATIRRAERARRQVTETTATVTASYERQQAARAARGRRAVGPEQHKGLIKLRGTWPAPNKPWPIGSPRTPTARPT